jgi:hypothetical protein
MLLLERVPHHRNIVAENGVHLELDSASFAPRWNAGWRKGRTGPVIGFKVGSREEVDRIYAELTAAGHVGLQPPYDAFLGRALRDRGGSGSQRRRRDEPVRSSAAHAASGAEPVVSLRAARRIHSGAAPIPSAQSVSARRSAFVSRASACRDT